MNLKRSIFEYGSNLGFVMAGFYITGEKKFLTPIVGIIVMLIRFAGKTFTELLEQEIPAPHNPLKIPK